MSRPLQPIHVRLNTLLFCNSKYCTNVMMFTGTQNVVSYVATVGYGAVI